MYIGYPPPLCTWRQDIPPPFLIWTPSGTPTPQKTAQKGCFWGQNSVVDQNSKELLKNLKYFLGSEPIFEKKCAKKGVKIGVLTILPYFTLLPYFPYFTLFRTLFSDEKG